MLQFIIFLLTLLLPLQPFAIINSGSTAQSLIYGEDFGSSLGRNLLTSTVAVAGAEGSRAIGDLYHAGTIGKPEQLLLHATVGCAQGAAISGNCGAGAAGQVVGELAADWYSIHALTPGMDLETLKANGSNIAEFAGALGGMVAGGDADDIYTSSSLGRTAAENNALTLLDAGFILLDVGELAHGYYVDDEGKIQEAYINLAADLVPGVPAGLTRLARFAKSVKEAEKVAEGVKAAEKIGQEVVETGVKKVDNFWTPKEVDGRKVYQRDELIDPNRVDDRTGLTNLELMQKGNAPIGKDGRPIELHHTTQQEVVGFTGNRGSVAEVESTFHQQNKKVIHTNVKDSNYPGMNMGIDKRSFRQDKVQNNEFNKFRENYWQQRANDFR